MICVCTSMCLCIRHSVDCFLRSRPYCWRAGAELLCFWGVELFQAVQSVCDRQECCWEPQHERKYFSTSLGNHRLKSNLQRQEVQWRYQTVRWEMYHKPPSTSSTYLRHGCPVSWRILDPASSSARQTLCDQRCDYTSCCPAQRWEERPNSFLLFWISNGVLEV